MIINRFEVFLVNLDPTVIVAPMTTKGREYPTRISCTFQGKKGQIVLDQIRIVDQKRLVKKLGTISKGTKEKTLSILQELFAN